MIFAFFEFLAKCRVKTTASMKTTAEQRAFLTTVDSLNEFCDVVRAGSTTLPLYHSFWSKKEIENARLVQADWDVPETLVPFYGDWHDLICMNIENGSIEMLDDARQRVFVWPSLDEFRKCLASNMQPPNDTSGVIESESWLDF